MPNKRAGLLTLCICVAQCGAAPLFLSDGFESPHIPTNTYLAGTVTDWTGVGSAYNGFGAVGGLFTDGNVALEPAPSQGTQMVFLNSQSTRPSSITRPLVAGGELSGYSSLTMTVDLGRAKLTVSHIDYSANTTLTVGFYSENAFVSALVLQRSSISAGTLVLDNELTLATSSLSPSQRVAPLAIRFDAQSSGPDVTQMLADNLRISFVTGVPCPGDLNHDGQVDDADFVFFVVAYNLLDCADPAMPAGCPADLNADGFVDDADFVVFVIAYNNLICP
ncbi:MAG: hypothetical protein ACREJD_16550 [Phycisphaerales bacterium]